MNRPMCVTIKWFYRRIDQKHSWNVIKLSYNIAFETSQHSLTHLYILVIILALYWHSESLRALRVFKVARRAWSSATYNTIIAVQSCISTYTYLYKIYMFCYTVSWWLDKGRSQHLLIHCNNNNDMHPTCILYIHPRIFQLSIICTRHRDEIIFSNAMIIVIKVPHTPPS